jgi:predicted Zn-dependent protease
VVKTITLILVRFMSRPQSLIAKFVVVAVLSCLITRTALGQVHENKANFAEIAAKAESALQAERLDEAAALYRKAVALKPTWAEGWWSLATLEYDRNSYKEAAAAFSKLVVLQPRSGTARVMLGLCEFELGKDDEALESIQEGQRLGVTSESQLRPVVMYHEAVLLQRKGRFEAAEEVLGQLCRQTPYPPEIDLAMGAIALRVRDQQLPTDGMLERQVMQATGKATCLGVQRKYDEARQEFDALVKQYPQYRNLHFAYGKVLLDGNDTEAAVSQFKAEIRNNPDDAVSRLRIASAEYRVDSAAGLPYAEEAVKLDPGLPLGHYLLGLLLLDTDDYLRAIPELEIAQKAFPDQPKVYFALSSAYSRAGRKEDANRAREEFVELNKKQESKPQPGDASLPGAAEAAAPPKP